MIAVWSMLLLPFTAHLLVGGGRFFAGAGIRKALAAGAAVLVLGAFGYDTFRIERNSSRAFPESDRQAGIYLNDLITADPDAKVLIESSRYFYLNIQVASQHPDAFIRNSVPDRAVVGRCLVDPYDISRLVGAKTTVLHLHWSCSKPVVRYPEKALELIR